jgi:hypothetical protein
MNLKPVIVNEVELRLKRMTLNAFGMEARNYLAPHTANLHKPESQGYYFLLQWT